MKKLPVRTKLLYGFGFSAQGIKDGLFQVFLFFYFSQILGLDATLTGTATIIALAFDAVSDPFVGVISDRWNSKKWGRRHPFMFASALPLGLFIWLLFLPPTGLGQLGLFLWLTIFTILVRISLTLFQVPGMSLGAELSTDYNERTSITSYRIMFGALMSTIIIVIGFIFFFVPTAAQARGLMNADAYPKFAFFCGILIILSILISTWGTKSAIPHLPKKNEKEPRLTLATFFQKIRTMLEMKSFRMLVLFLMIIYIGLGIGTVFTTYFMEYFFEFSELEMAALPIATGIAGIVALIMGPIIGKMLDKKWAVFFSTILFCLLFSLPYNLRLLHLFPENGAPDLIGIFFLCILLAYTFLWIALSLAYSMMADVVDEFELKTGERQEGLFFSVASLAYKSTVGFGYFFAGLLLNWIAFPKQTAVNDVPTEAIYGLGLVGGPIILCFYLTATIFIAIYPITKERYQEIRNQLDAKS